MAKPILQVCESFVGIKEIPANSNRTSLGLRYGQNGVAWCGIAVAMAFKDAGIDLQKVLTANMASTVAIQSAGKKKGWFLSARSAKPTDIVLYHMPGGRNGVNHVGVVRTVGKDGITAFEGNTGLSGSQYAGGAYLMKSRPWSLILGVIRIPFADSLGYSNAKPPPPPAAMPEPRKLPVREALVYHTPGTPISPQSQGRLVEIAQWEISRVSGAQFTNEIGIFGDLTKWNLVTFGRFFGKQWDGNWIGPDQWELIDFVYLSKGWEPVLR